MPFRETARAPGDRRTTVRLALAALQTGRPGALAPLRELHIVSRRVRATGLAATDESLAWAVGVILADVVADGLRAARASGGDAGPLPTDTSDRLLAEDFTSNAPEREAWSALQHRYFARPPLGIGDLVRITGTPRRTVGRRLALGYGLVADRLLEREALARAGTDGAVARLALPQALADLAPSEALPPLRPAQWAQATTLATWMVEQPEAFVAQLGTLDIAFAGRCAADPALRMRLTPGVRDALLAALVGASRDPNRDLRERIAAAEALAPLGDPRFATHRGPDGDALVAPMVARSGGSYPVGSDDGAEPNTAPRHRVRLAPYGIGRFPVTRREWAAFIAAGGYDDSRWWDGPSASAWQRGVGTSHGLRAFVDEWTAKFRSDPAAIDAHLAAGGLTPEQAARWRGRVAMSSDELAAYLAEIYPDERHVAPRDWRDEPADGLRPVDGITWFEARAYCRWLAAQTGRPFRLPTEAEWEAAAAGRAGRTYPPGEVVGSECGNTVELHVRSATPIGLFPAGDTPDGIADLVGNVRTWTSTVWGPSPTGPPAYAYPYRATDGREADEAGQACRVARGSSYLEPLTTARCVLRAVAERPSIRLNAIGLRLAEGSTG